jgi:predicted AAA+ superfamily ATPase
VAPNIKPETVSTYVGLLERLFVVEAQRAWAPRLQSRARLRTSPKYHLADPALATAALNADHQRLSQELTTVGLLFESAVIHDLAVYAAALGGEVRHYRDSNGYEIDAIVTLPGGRWGAVEVKLGGGQAPAGALSLAGAIDQIDTSTAGEPVFRLVVTGTGSVYVMEDGTITCPLTALSP